MPQEPQPTETKEKPEPKDHLVVTQHKITINGQEIAYTVTAGTIILKEEPDREKEYEGEKPKAQFFFIAYTKDGLENPAERPLTFSFNGGPCCSTDKFKDAILINRYNVNYFSFAALFS